MKNITLFDGATGTRLWQLAQQAGLPRESVWKYNLSAPALVEQVAAEYIGAGSDILCTNTFGANRLAVERESAYSVEQVITAAVGIAKKAAAGKNVRVALDVGPLSVLMEPYGDLTEEEAAEIFTEMMESGVKAGADCIFIETFMDLEMMRVAAECAKAQGVSVLCSMTFEKSGRTLMGNRVEDIVETLEPLGIEAVGMNCSLGPDTALPILKEYAEHTSLPLIFKPNAGLPSVTADGATVFACACPDFLREMEPALSLASYVGGCCGTDVDYIRGLREMIDKR